MLSGQPHIMSKINLIAVLINIISFGWKWASRTLHGVKLISCILMLCTTRLHNIGKKILGYIRAWQKNHPTPRFWESYFLHDKPTNSTELGEKLSDHIPHEIHFTTGRTGDWIHIWWCDKFGPPNYTKLFQWFVAMLDCHKTHRYYSALFKSSVKVNEWKGNTLHCKQNTLVLAHSCIPMLTPKNWFSSSIQLRNA